MEQWRNQMIAILIESIRSASLLGQKNPLTSVVAVSPSTVPCSGPRDSPRLVRSESFQFREGHREGRPGRGHSFPSPCLRVYTPLKVEHGTSNIKNIQSWNLSYRHGSCLSFMWELQECKASSLFHISLTLGGSIPKATKRSGCNKGISTTWPKWGHHWMKHIPQDACCLFMVQMNWEHVCFSDNVSMANLAF